MAGAAYIRAAPTAPPGRSQRRAKTARRLWGALRRNIPTVVAPSTKRRFTRPRVPKFMINPETTPKRVWDLLLASFVVYTTVVVPYRVCFKRDAHGGFHVAEQVMDIAFGIDIALNFFTGIYLPTGELTYSIRAIAKEYVRGWFFIDFFSTVQFDLFMQSSSISHDESDSSVAAAASSKATALLSTKLLRSLKVLKLVKLARVRRLGQMFSSLEDAVTTNQSAVSLVKLALSMLFFAHIVACVWFAIGAQNDEMSWILALGYDDVDLADEALLQYLASMYWAIVTMGTIGYGDIVATNNAERLANVAVMAIGVSFFGYVMGTISTLVTNLDVSAALYDKRMKTVKEYIRSRQINNHMSKKVRNHFEYYYQNHSVFKERKILERLPSALRNEMIHDVYAKLVASIKYFSECHCHASLVSDIVMLMHPFAVLKNEYVYVQHEIAAHVFFLLKGKIYVSRTRPGANGEVKLGSHSTGEHFGEMEVYDHDHGNGVRMCSAVARSFCELTFLSRESILKLSERWPEVLKHFQDTARESSARLRKRAGTTVGDDMYSLFRDHTVTTAMLQTPTIVKTSVPPSGRASSRISPFLAGDDHSDHSDHSDDDHSSSDISAPIQDQHQPAAPPRQVHRFVSGNFDARGSARSTRSDLPLAQEDDNDSNASAQPATTASFTGAHPSMQPRSSRLLSTLDKPRELEIDSSASVAAATADVSSAAAIAIATSELPPQQPASPPKVMSPLFKRKSAITFTDLASNAAAAGASDAAYVDPPPPDAGASYVVDTSQPPVATVATVQEPLPSHADQSTNGDDNDRASNHEPSRCDEQATLLQPPTSMLPMQPPTQQQPSSSAPSDGRRMSLQSLRRSSFLLERRASLLARSNTMRRDLQSMVEKLRSPTVQPTAQQNITAELLLLKGSYIFHPQEPFIVTWQFIVGLAILYSIVIVPLRLGFAYEATGGWFALELAMDSLFLIDILLSFRTAYVNDEKLLIYDARVICRKYAKSWFVPDLLSTVPFDDLISLFYGASDGHVNLFATKLLRLTRIVRLLKLMRLIKLSRVFGKIRDIVQISPWAERLVRLMVMMLLFCHWNACLFHAAMLMSEGASLPTWCDVVFRYTTKNYETCSTSVALADRYVAAMYWAFTTLTTVGYGDIRPSVYSIYELALVIVLIVVNATFFGYIVSSVMDLIQNFDPSDREYKLLMTEMKDYLRESSASARLCSIVKVHFKHHITCNSLFPEQKIFDKLSPSLRFDLARLVAGESLFAIPLITVMEDAFKGFVSYALFRFKPMCIVRSEKVCRSGGPGTEMFFLVEGECEVVHAHTGAGRVIGENSVFEQYALMAKPDEIYRTVSTVTALTKKCILYSFSIQDFRALEDVSPAVSTYFLSQIAAVLTEDDLYELSPIQKANVDCALRCGRVFRSVAEHHQRTQLNSLGKVALANLYQRRGSEWTPDLLPRQLKLMGEKEAAVHAAAVHAAAGAKAVATGAKAAAASTDAVAVPSPPSTPAAVASTAATDVHTRKSQDADDGATMAQHHLPRSGGSFSNAAANSSSSNNVNALNGGLHVRHPQPQQLTNNSKVLPALKLPAIKSFAGDDTDVTQAVIDSHAPL